jgi:hypothetical protein
MFLTGEVANWKKMFLTGEVREEMGIVLTIQFNIIQLITGWIPRGLDVVLAKIIYRLDQLHNFLGHSAE